MISIYSDICVRTLSKIVSIKRIYEFQKTTEKYDIRISLIKIKIIAFNEKHSIQSKVIFYGTALEQARKVNYIG